jgi:hypothetical protein
LLVLSVVVVVVESVGFLSACSLAWSFFQLLDRSVVVIPGMTGTMGALLGLERGILRNMGSLNRAIGVNFFGKGKPQQARPSAGARPDCIRRAQ